MRRYGVPCTALDPDVRRRQLETLRRNHPDLPADAQGPFEAPSVQAVARASHLARYGVENPFAREDVKGHYVVLWDGFETLSDSHLWLDSGAPDGHDWEQEYSWLD